MHQLLFAHPQHLKAKHLLDYAGQAGLDIARFQNEMNNHVYLQRVHEHVQDGQQPSMRSMPVFMSTAC